MSAISRVESVREVVYEAVTPVPSAVPGEFVVHLGAGWGRELHDLANKLAVSGEMPEDAVGVLLSCLEFVWVEIEGVDECRNLLKGLELIRGAVMTAGIEAAGVGRGGFI